MAAVRGRRSLDEADPFLPPGPGAHLRSGAEMAALFARYPTAVPTAAADRRGVLVRPASGGAEPAAVRRPARARRELPSAATHHGRRGPPIRPAGEPTGRLCTDREGIADHRRSQFPRLFPHRPRHRRFLPDARRSSARAGDRQPIPRCATRWASPRWTRCGTSCCSNGSWRRNGTARRTSTSTSNPTAGRRSSSTSTTSTAGTTPHKWPTSTPFARGWRSGTWPRRSGHSPGQQDAYSKQLDGWTPLAAQVENASNGGGGIEHPIPADVLDLAGQIQDFPRHLGIHSGGMVICDRPVAQVCPVEWGRMENRSVLQWDKDDCAAMGLVKFDLLGLGMLSALHYAVDLVREHEGIEVDFATAGSGGTGGLRDAAARRFGGGVPGRVPGADGHPAPAQAAHVLRPGGRGGADPARPDPGRLGAPLHPPPQRPGAGHLRPPGDGAVAGQDAGHPAVPGAADATGGGRRRVRRRRGRSAAPGDGRQTIQQPRWRS